MSKNISHIWIGRFGPKAPQLYFESQREWSETPLCHFAAEQGEHSFDYDFVEISYLFEFQNVRSFVNGHSYSDSYIEKVVSQAADLGIKEINVFVLANKDEFSNPRSVSGDDFQLWYLGEFDCEA